VVTKEEIEKVHQLFSGIDNDNDGKLDKRELKIIYEKYAGVKVTDEMID
jgi:Ca2+-binding EF-hand superfamily protein